MKTVSTQLADSRSAGTTTLVWLWKIVRQDSQVFGFTNHDQDIEYDGVTYAASTGFTPANIGASVGLSVDNTEVEGILSSGAITESDLSAGLWDRAHIQVLEVDYKNLSYGHMVLRTGSLGDVSVKQGVFTAEVRGLAQKLQQPIGRTYSSGCDATLGDARCGVLLSGLSVTGYVSYSPNRQSFADVSRAEPTDYFGNGYVEFLTGANVGVTQEVQSFDSGVFSFYLPVPYPVVAGDQYRAYPGCRKRFEQDCKDKFNNAINFRGFPHLPLNDRVLGTAGISEK